MDIQEFVKKSIEQDDRNKFTEGDICEYEVPNELTAFYRKANPIDVEVMINGEAVKFFPLEKLEELQGEYFLGDIRFVFASCNGDPIYIYKGNVYTCIHGVNDIKDEYIAESLEEYFEKID